MRHTRWHRLARATGVFAGAGWSIAVAVQITDSNTSALTALLGLATLRATGLAVALGIVWGPLAAWVPARAPVRAAAGLVAGLLASLSGIYLYFVLWPPQWNPGSTLELLKLFCVTYGLRALPLGAAGGLLASMWAGRVGARALEDA